jgi:hypothetical protein
MKKTFFYFNEGIAEYLSELREGRSTQLRHGKEISDVNWNDKNLKVQCNSWVKSKGSIRIPRM